MSDKKRDKTRIENTTKTDYEPPRLLKKRSVKRVTLFSGSGGSPTSII